MCRPRWLRSLEFDQAPTAHLRAAYDSRCGAEGENGWYIQRVKLDAPRSSDPHYSNVTSTSSALFCKMNCAGLSEFVEFIFVISLEHCDTRVLQTPTLRNDSLSRRTRPFPGSDDNPYRAKRPVSLTVLVVAGVSSCCFSCCG